MKLENGYKKVYTVTEDGVRTLHATKDVLNPAADEVIVDKAKAQTLKTANFYQDGDKIRYVLGANRAIDRTVDPELTEVQKLFVAQHVHTYTYTEGDNVIDHNTNICTFTIKCSGCENELEITVPGTLDVQTNTYSATLTHDQLEGSFTVTWEAETSNA